MQSNSREINTPPYLSAGEIDAVRSDGPNATMLPPRFYHSEEIYQFEVEKVFRKNWIAVGRWDQVENPGDYLTIDLFGEPIVVVRDKGQEIHALLNVCQHRWAKIVEGEGNIGLFVCPYHRWTYNLDGTLRAVAGPQIEGFNKRTCSMPTLKVELWQGFIFVNFDPDALPLAPQLEQASELLDRRGLSEYRFGDAYHYDAPWNWKFSFENAIEGYHDIGIHFERIGHIIPAELTYTDRTDGPFIIYRTPLVPEAKDWCLELGRPPHMTDEEYENILDDHLIYVAVFPNLLMYVTWEKVGWIIFEHNGATDNKGATCLAFAPHTLDHPNFETFKENSIKEACGVQDEDSIVCARLQEGVTSKSIKSAILHPIERDALLDFHRWLIDQYLAE